LPPFRGGIAGQARANRNRPSRFRVDPQVCHGKAARPGNAPKPYPSRYTPEFVHDRATNGFRGMPARKEQYPEEAVAVVIMGKGFSN
jgi:hypothetical protein